MFELYRQHCAKLQSTGKHRQLPELHANPHTITLDFSSNDYFGLSRRPEVLDAAIKAGEQYGAGATGSRVLSGHNMLFEQFESRIACDKQTETALLFNSGFQANTAVLSSLLDQRVLHAKPIVFFDKLNHASLYQAVFLSQAELVRYRHLDYQHLTDSLNQFKSDTRPKFIVTETLFGMDGDLVSLDAIFSLAHQYGAFVYLDEAHALGMIGPNGYGLSTTKAFDGPMLVMGSLSKALGSSGAYVACDHVLKDYLINKATGFMYSTAPSPMVIGAAQKAWEMLPSFEEERRRALALAQSFAEQLMALKWRVGAPLAHIVPVILNEPGMLQRIYTRLQKAGIQASLIRSPTVPASSERLRFAIHGYHDAQDIQHVVDVLTS
jgi:8-amino-7-oxononanoate synthase